MCNSCLEIIKKLRQILKKNNLDGFIFYSQDDYGNEIIAPYYQRIAFLTGFKGSTSRLLMLRNKASLFVDGRYQLQAKKEVDTKLYEINSWEEFFPFLLRYTKNNHRIGFDGNNITVEQKRHIIKQTQDINLELICVSKNPVDEIWHTRSKQTSRSAESAGSAENVGSTGDAEGMGSAGGVESVGCTGDAEGMGSAGGVESVGSTGDAEGMENAESAGSAESTESAGSAGSAENVGSTGDAEGMRIAESVESTGDAEGMGSTGSAENVGSTGDAEGMENAESAEDMGSAESAEGMGSAGGVESVESTESAKVDDSGSAGNIGIRPPPPVTEIYPYPLSFSGKNSKQKIIPIIEKMKIWKCQIFILTSPANIAWLFNLRASGLDFSPLPLIFAALDINSQKTIFCDKYSITKKINDDIDVIKTNTQIDDFCKKLKNKTIAIDPSTCPCLFYEKIKSHKPLRIIEKNDPSTDLKAIKNKTEIKNMEDAHIRDGAALTSFLFWVYSLKNEDQDEYSAQEKLLSLRKKQKFFVSPSFETISANGPNSSIIHYQPKPHNARKMKLGSIYLIDSGAQYYGATTDVTRVTIIGNTKTVNQEIKKYYTLVLKCHIEFARACFPNNSKGNCLDFLARQNLYKIGQGYNHSSGHGIGSFSNVHESPPSISPLSNHPIKENMILTNEPAYYQDDNFGIRLENVMKTKKINPYMLGFDILTLAPFEPRLIDFQKLNYDEINWLKEYHLRVIEKLSPMLSQDCRIWLENILR